MAVHCRPTVATDLGCGTCGTSYPMASTRSIWTFAVDTPKLDGDENTTAAVVGFMLHFHTLAKAELIGIWGH